MPIYEYECGSCSHHFDKKQGFDAEPKAVCPRCEGKARRVFHAAPVIFKGSGFYITDHRPSHEKHTPSSKGESKSAPAGKGESKGEAAAGKGQSESATAKS